MFKRFFLTEKNMMVTIMINAFIIFLMYFPQFQKNEFLELVDNFFIILLLVEAIVKLQEMTFKGYFSSRWNQFDFLIVAFSLPALLPHGDAPLILLLRLFRLIRLVRFFKFVPHLASILEGLGRAVKASIFVILVLFLLNFMLALFTCHFYREAAPQYFGNPLTSCYSIFQMFTVEGWNEIPTAIIESEYGPKSNFFIGLTRFYFVIVVLIGGIFGMSLANAIFVDEMTIDNTRELEEKIDRLQEQIVELKDLIKSNK